MAILIFAICPYSVILITPAYKSRFISKFAICPYSVIIITPAYKSEIYI